MCLGRVVCNRSVSNRDVRVKYWAYAKGTTEPDRTFALGEAFNSKVFFNQFSSTIICNQFSDG